MSCLIFCSTRLSVGFRSKAQIIGRVSAAVLCFLTVLFEKGNRLTSYSFVWVIVSAPIACTHHRATTYNIPASTRVKLQFYAALPCKAVVPAKSTWHPMVGGWLREGRPDSLRKVSKILPRLRLPSLPCLPICSAFVLPSTYPCCLSKGIA